MRKLAIVGAAILAAAVLFVALRPDGDAAAPPTTTSAPTTASQSPTAPAETVATAQRPPAPARPGPARVCIAVREAQPVGGVRRVTVARGRRVILEVTSDVADHVHLHGYDVIRDVGPGQPARLPFRATIAGTVEAELEDRRVLLAQVTAKP